MIEEKYYNYLCGCGCRNRIKIKLHHKYHGIPKFILGHNWKGKHHTEATKKRISETETGKVVSKETRERIRKATVGKKKHFKKRRKKIEYSKEYRYKQSEIVKNAMKRPEVRMKICGENSPHWKGGISRLPYPFNFDYRLKELIRERDNYTCQLCGKTKEEKDRNLSVHHIDYIKENCDPRNLITLCSSCNSKINLERKHWIKFFQLKLKLIG